MGTTTIVTKATTAMAAIKSTEERRAMRVLRISLLLCLFFILELHTGVTEGDNVRPINSTMGTMETLKMGCSSPVRIHSVFKHHAQVMVSPRAFQRNDTGLRFITPASHTEVNLAEAEDEVLDGNITWFLRTLSPEKVLLGFNAVVTGASREEESETVFKILIGLVGERIGMQTPSISCSSAECQRKFVKLSKTGSKVETGGPQLSSKSLITLQTNSMSSLLVSL